MDINTHLHIVVADEHLARNGRGHAATKGHKCRAAELVERAPRHHLHELLALDNAALEALGRVAGLGRQKAPRGLCHFHAVAEVGAVPDTREHVHIILPSRVTMGLLFLSPPARFLMVGAGTVIWDAAVCRGCAQAAGHAKRTHSAALKRVEERVSHNLALSLAQANARDLPYAADDSARSSLLLPVHAATERATRHHREVAVAALVLLLRPDLGIVPRFCLGHGAAAVAALIDLIASRRSSNGKRRLQLSIGRTQRGFAADRQLAHKRSRREFMGIERR